ncbi:MAG: tetratricopeptide repeat protein [Crocinitomicaceae bacterium]|nr:tetratricopeptide repeat protein [Crocinitomicaceae bacterium]MCF8410683.1 tetratricopeptide repeat protein [Crocinitomicaceae bacterium]
MKIKTTYRVIVFFSLFCLSRISAQKINEAEYKYVITKNCGDVQYHSRLQQIHEQIIRGNYEKSERIISKLRRVKSISPAIKTYLSSILYVQSNYDYSIRLCDSVLNELSSQKTNGYYIRALNYKAKAVSAKGDNNLALQLVNEALKLSLESSDQFMLASSYYFKGVFLSEIGKHEEATQLLLKSKVLSEKLNDKINMAATSSFIGLAYSHLGKYAEAIDLINESIIIRSELGDKRGLANSYLNMNKVYTELGDKEKRFEYENKSLKICEEIGDQQCISGRLTNIGDIYFIEGKYDKALYYQFKAQKIAQKIGIKYRIAEIQYHLAEIYNAQKKYALALSHIDTSIQIRSENQDNEGVSSGRIVKATILVNENKLAEAQSQAEKALEIGQKYDLIHIKRDAHQILSLIYDKKGNSERAFFHYKNYQGLKDSLFNIEKSKVFIRKELENKYQIEEINNKKKEALKQLELEKQNERINKLFWIGIILILSLLVVSYLIYLKYQSQRKINFIVTQNQTLNNQIANLEKQSIFSQTIATVAHELNTPLGIIHAGNGEMKELIERQKQQSLHLFSEKDQLFISKWQPFILEQRENLSGRLKRKQEQVLLADLIQSSAFSLEKNEKLAHELAEWNLQNDSKEFITELLQTNLSLEVFAFLDWMRKSFIINSAVTAAVKSSNKVVMELNDLSDNHLNIRTIEKTSLYDTIKKVIELDEKLTKRTIHVHLTIEPNQFLYVDQNQFIQLTNQLIQNMSEALTEISGTRILEITHQSTEGYEILSFSNNGAKISDDVLPRIFDRFFSTKDKSIHRGLGLSIVKSIIENHGGHITINSAAERTTFNLHFIKRG